MSYTLQYYDLVLVAIVSSVIAGGAVGYLTTVPMPIAIVGLGSVAVALIGHALFVNGPVDDLEELTDEVDADLVEIVNPVE
jgi:hypothetical protein